MVTENIVISVTDKGTLVVRRNLAAVGATAQKSASSVDFLKRALTGLAVIQGLRAVVNTLRDFDQALSTVRAISGATADQFEELRDIAKELGATTRFSATQAAEGLLFLSRAGFTVNEQLQSIEGTLQLAQAGALDLGSAADIASNALRGFRLEADETSRVVDVMALAANSANTTVLQLGDALKFVAPIAAGVGVEIEETTAAIAALSDAGLQSTLAGTGLRRVISELESPSTKTRKILEALGLTTNDVIISQVGLTTALQNLSEAGVTTGQALEIFGDRGGPAFEVLSNSIPQVIRMTEELKNAEGTAASIAEVMDDNLNGALLAVRSAVEALVLAFGDLGNTSILTVSFRALATAIRFLANNVEILQGALIGLAVATLPFLITQLKALAVAIASTGFGAILVVIGAATGALVAFSDEIQVTTDSTATLADVAAVTFDSITSGVGDAIVSLANLIPSIGGVEVSFATVGDVFIAAIRKILQLIDILIGAMQGAAAAIIASFQDLPRLILDIFIRAFNAALRVVGDAIGSMIDLLNNLPGVDIDFDRNFLQLENQFEDAGNNVGAAFLDAFNNRIDSGAESLLDDVLFAAENRALARESAEQLAIARARQPQGAAPSGPTGAGAPPVAAAQSLGLSGVLADLERQERLLRMTNEQRQIEQDLLTITEKLRKDGIELTNEEEEQLRQRLGQVQALTQVSAALDQVRGSELDLIAVQQELNNQIAAGQISTEEATQAYRILQDQVLATATSMEAGFQRGFNAIIRQASDLATQTENLLVGAFDSSTDALTDFITTGKADFAGLIDSILRDVTKLLINQAFTALIGGLGGGLFGGGAGGGGGLFAGLFQNGGTIPAGQFGIGGEAGTEIISRPTLIGGPAQVTPVSGAAPEVNVQIVNVTSQEEAADAINTPRGTQNIMNVISQNRDQVNQSLGK